MMGKREDSRGRSFVMIMLVIAISALLLRFALEKIIKVSISQNESTAQATLKLISASLENYAKDHQAAYPANFAVLTQNKPPYLDKDYLEKSPIRGYDYNCSKLDASGYNCSATPVKCNLNGRKIYSVTTGALFVTEECSKKEY